MCVNSVEMVMKAVRESVATRVLFSYFCGEDLANARKKLVGTVSPKVSPCCPLCLFARTLTLAGLSLYVLLCAYRYWESVVRVERLAGRVQRL